MSLDLVKVVLSTPEAQNLPRRMSMDAWIEDWVKRGDRVRRFRDYFNGVHPANLSDEMADMLRVNVSDAFDRFNDNYCGKVVRYMNNRLRIMSIEADTDPANEWIEDRLAFNRFDALQIDTHEATIRDADTCILISFDNVAQKARLTHEPLWNGVNGMLLVKDSLGTVQAAVKVWQESRAALGDTTRITVYYADRMEKWISHDGGAPVPYIEKDKTTGRELDWPAPLMVRSEPMGVPVVHFRNQGGVYGLSALEDVIPLQNGLNRELQSLVMASELTAFQVKVALAFDPPAGLAPGSWVTISTSDVSTEYHEPKAYTLDMGEVIPYIQACDFLVGQISQVSDTPLPGMMGGDTQSGEALKQREIGLLGKVEQFQVRNGNSWEDVIRLMSRMEAAHATQQPPVYERLSTRWKKPEIRNDKQVVENAQVLDNMGYHEEALRQMAQVFDWDEQKIQDLLAEKRAAQQTNFLDLAGNGTIPTFEQFRANGGAN